jgi:hypothetical protein
LRGGTRRGRDEGERTKYIKEILHGGLIDSRLVFLVVEPYDEIRVDGFVDEAADHVFNEREAFLEVESEKNPGPPLSFLCSSSSSFSLSPSLCPLLLPFTSFTAFPPPYHSSKDPNTSRRELLPPEQLKMGARGKALQINHLENEFHFSPLLHE